MVDNQADNYEGVYSNRIGFGKRPGVLIIYTKVEYHPSGINGGRFFEKALPLRNLIRLGHGRLGQGYCPGGR